MKLGALLESNDPQKDDTPVVQELGERNWLEVVQGAAELLEIKKVRVRTHADLTRALFRRLATVHASGEHGGTDDYGVRLPGVLDHFQQHGYEVAVSVDPDDDIGVYGRRRRGQGEPLERGEWSSHMGKLETQLAEFGVSVLNAGEDEMFESNVYRRITRGGLMERGGVWPHDLPTIQQFVKDDPSAHLVTLSDDGREFILWQYSPPEQQEDQSEGESGGHSDSGPVLTDDTGIPA